MIVKLLLFVYVEWLRPKSGNENKKVEKGKNKPPVNAEDIAERIFSQSGWQLSEPVSLSDMVDILIDFWEAEGLYD